MVKKKKFLYCVKMATSSDVHINALSVESYDDTRKCHECGEEKPAEFEWMVVTCGCGCGAKKRTCDLCPAGSLPTCDGIDHIKIYRKLNKECTTQ